MVWESNKIILNSELFKIYLCCNVHAGHELITQSTSGLVRLACIDFIAAKNEYLWIRADLESICPSTYLYKGMHYFLSLTHEELLAKHNVFRSEQNDFFEIDHRCTVEYEINLLHQIIELAHSYRKDGYFFAFEWDASDVSLADKISRMARINVDAPCTGDENYYLHEALS